VLNRRFGLLTILVVMLVLLVSLSVVVQADEGGHHEEPAHDEAPAGETGGEDAHADGTEEQHQGDAAGSDQEGNAAGSPAGGTDGHSDAEDSTVEGESGHDEAEGVHEDGDDHGQEAAAGIAQTTDRFLIVGGEAFVEALLNFIVAVLWMLLVALQLARPYILQLVQKFSLRLGADLWWLAYVLIRDLVAAMTFVLSFFFFYPMLLEERPFPMFGALAAVLLFASLVVRLVGDPDDDPGAYVLETNLIGIGAALYLVSVIFGVQATKIEALQPISKFLVTQSNTALAFSLLWLSMIAFVVLGLYAVGHVLRTARTRAD